jgi:hypothetical protein
MDDQFAWLIEAPGQFYLTTKTIGRQSEFQWTRDANKALRFASKEQAAGVQYAVHKLQPDLFSFSAVLADAAPVEHGFMSRTE